MFGNLTKTTEQQENSNKVNQIIDEINHELSSNSSSAAVAEGTITYLPSLSSTHTTKTDNINSSKSYISEIRSLLKQVSSTYSANDTAKAKELVNNCLFR